MKKVFILNGGQKFAHSGGQFNDTVSEWTKEFFSKQDQTELKYTDIKESYDLQEEIDKFIWADVLIYHTPIWWFHIPNEFKKYFDEILTAGHENGIYKNDGRSIKNPDISYGSGGLLHGRKYMLTTSWNAPATAFTLEGEFFQQKSVDESIMFGFHKMNVFTGMEPLDSFHFYDMEKEINVERIQSLKENYLDHLEKVVNTASLSV